MNRFWIKYRPVIISLVVWFTGIQIIGYLALYVLPQRTTLYIGPSYWANFDGIHYLKIAREGYYDFSEAFFPLYPILISKLFQFFRFLPPFWIARTVSVTAFLAGLLLWYDLLTASKNRNAFWTILFVLLFPTAFFFQAVYTEGLYFLLTILSYRYIRRRKFIPAGIAGALSSATRLYGLGILILGISEYNRIEPKKRNFKQVLGLCLIPLGLLLYMLFLYNRTGDPFAFFHVQSAFGANRSGSDLVLLPQVIWRYLKIIFTAFMQPTPFSYLISILEFVISVGAFVVVYIGWKMKTDAALLIYSLILLLVPTLIGTFSSMPRYVLVIFPLFEILGNLRSVKVKSVILGLFALFQIGCIMLFVRGWFVG